MGRTNPPFVGVATNRTGVIAVREGDDALAVSVLDGDGARLWTQTLGPANSGTQLPIAVGEDGSVYLAGAFDQPLDGTDLVPEGHDLFVVSYAPDGTLRWANSYGAAGAALSPNALIVDASGHVVVGGVISDAGGGVDLGAGTLGQSTGFLITLESDGSLAWTRPAAGESALPAVDALAATPQGLLVAAGQAIGPGCAPLSLTRYQANDGASAGSHVFDGEGFAVDLRVDDAGATYLSVLILDALDAGAGSLSNGGAVLKLDAADHLVWERQYGDRAYVYLALDAGSNVVAVGEYQGEIWLDTRYANDGTGYSNFVAKYAPDGTLIWGDGNWKDYAYQAAPMPNGDLILVSDQGIERMSP